MGEATPLEINWFAYSGMLLFSLLLSLYIYSLSGALLNRYAAGRLTPDTHWSDLRSTFFAIAGRLSAQTGIAMLLLVVVAFIAGLLISLGESGPGQLPVVGLIFTAFFLLMLVALIPSLSLMQYPIYLELASGWSAIKKGFRLGFRHWRSTLLTAFLGVLITIAVFYIAAMPYVLYLIFNIVHLGWGGVPLLFVPYAILLFLIPISVFFMAFQYTSIAEKEKKDRARESVG
jgi:hypothetical protein